MWLRNVSYDLCVLTCCWWRHYNITAICSIWVDFTSSLAIAVTCVSFSVSFVSVSLSFWLVQCWNSSSILFLNKFKESKNLYLCFWSLLLFLDLINELFLIFLMSNFHFTLFKFWSIYGDWLQFNVTDIRVFWQSNSKVAKIGKKDYHWSGKLWF